MRIRAIVVVLTLLTTVGCTYPGPGRVSTDGTLEEYHYTLSDGRVITCLGFYGGLSCDWTPR